MFSSLFFGPTEHKTTYLYFVIFFFFSRPKQKFSLVQPYWGGGQRGSQREVLPLESLLPRQESRGSITPPPELRPWGSQGGSAVTLKWCGVSCFVRSPAEGEIEGALWKPPLEHRKWQVCRNSWILYGNLLWILFPSSLKNPPGLNQVSVWSSTLHTDLSDSIFSPPYQFEICQLQILSVKTKFSSWI